MWCWTVSKNIFPTILKQIFLFFNSDISFLCDAKTTPIAQEQQNKLNIHQRTTDKSAIRAIPREFQQEPVCFPSNIYHTKKKIDFFSLGYCST